MLFSSRVLSKRASLLVDGEFALGRVFSVPLSVPRPPPQSDSRVLAFAEKKSHSEVQSMKIPCEIAASALLLALRMAQPGITTAEIDFAVASYIASRGAYPSGIGFMGFPRAICVSVNEVIAHGIPDTRPLKDGDIVNFDVTCWKNDWFGDCSGMALIGAVDEESKRLVRVTREAMDSAIDRCVVGAEFGVIPKTISKIASDSGFSIVDYFAGHFIGRQMHMLPNVMHWDAGVADGIKSTSVGPDLVLEEGHVFTIEPILCEGSPAGRCWKDGWTYVTLDGGRTAQWEHTIVVTKDGPVRLTEPDDQGVGRERVVCRG